MSELRRMATDYALVVHLNDIPPVLRWLQWFSILKYLLEALAVNEVGSGLQIVDVLQGVPVNVSAQLIMNLVSTFVRSLLVPFLTLGSVVRIWSQQLLSDLA
ncbi:14955_t:CDS:2 [Acaulospora colombiana]|uniref:14955_t:CDS:1 n=1 Tax=Acaulospora colombiana TaxID=27376 RepID=A0ACA9NE63_9GLOM|nr:14955_t:CDS:2 [Acaulospora colombiana]